MPKEGGIYQKAKPLPASLLCVLFSTLFSIQEQDGETTHLLEGHKREMGCFIIIAVRM